MSERADRARLSVNALLWTGQWALAATFFVLGLLKVLLPATDLQLGLHLVPAAPAAILGTVGLVELLGSLGAILPAATGVLPRLSTAAAACLAGVALLGVLVPGTAGAFALPLPNALLALAGGWVAWGRSRWAPIAPLGLREAAREDRQRAEAGDRRRAARATQAAWRRSGAA